MAVYYGERAVYGVMEPKPISNLPDGAKVRLRLRAKRLGIAVVRTGNKTSKWILGNNGETWSLLFEEGANVRENR
jgi:hypothetical protein